MATPTVPAHRLNPADASPELRAKLAAARERAIATRHLDGPPAVVTGEAVRFTDSVRRAVAEIKRRREAVGRSVADVAAVCGVADEVVTGLEAGTLLNPTWKLLGDYAAAAGVRLTLGIEPGE
jgi:hypothetical protein